MSTPEPAAAMKPKNSASVWKKAGRMLGSLLFMMVAGILLWWVTLYLMQDTMIYARHMVPASAAGVSYPGEVRLERVVAGELAYAVFVPVPGLKPGQTAPVLVFCHGNAELIEHQAWIVDQYHRMGVSVLLPEYRGFGRSTGNPSQVAIREDSLYFLDQVLHRPDVDPKRVVFHGRSLGGAVAADLAAHHQPAGLIIESTFTSIVSMANRRYAPGLIVRHPYRTDLVLQAAKFPILMFHGLRDEIIPLAEGRQLHELAKRSGQVVRYYEFDAGHNEFPGRAEPEYWRAIEAFLTEQGVLAAEQKVVHQEAGQEGSQEKSGMP